jgi:hypothetical protein
MFDVGTLAALGKGLDTVRIQLSSSSVKFFCFIVNTALANNSPSSLSAQSHYVSLESRVGRRFLVGNARQRGLYVTGTP